MMESIVTNVLGLGEPQHTGGVGHQGSVDDEA